MNFVVCSGYLFKIGAAVCGAIILCKVNLCYADRSIFCGAADQLKKIQFIPIQQMDNEMLLESVANTLDNSMSSEVRLLNHYWLNSSEDNTRVNRAAANRIVAITLATYYDLAMQSLIPGEPDKHAVEHTALVGVLGDYNLRLSKNSAQLGWHIRF